MGKGLEETKVVKLEKKDGNKSPHAVERGTESHHLLTWCKGGGCPMCPWATKRALQVMISLP